MDFSCLAIDKMEPELCPNSALNLDKVQVLSLSDFIDRKQLE